MELAETRDEELARLIAEQEEDDNRKVVYPAAPQVRGKRVIALDAVIPGGDDTPHDIDVGVEYDFETMIEQGDYGLQGTVVHFLPHESMPLQDIPHGTHNGYHNYGCRCDPCRLAFNKVQGIYNRRTRQKKYDARPDRVCANERCKKLFRPVPSTKLYCCHKCADTTRQRAKRRRMEVENPEWIAREDARLLALHNRHKGKRKQ